MDHALHLLNPCWNLWLGCVMQKTCREGATQVSLKDKSVCTTSTSCFSVHSLEGQEELKARISLLRRTKAIMILVYLCYLASTVSEISFFSSLFNGQMKYGNTSGDEESYNPMLLKSQTSFFFFARWIIRVHFKQSHSILSPCCMVIDTRFYVCGGTEEQRAKQFKIPTSHQNGCIEEMSMSFSGMTDQQGMVLELLFM